ncbi:hypothetical protein Tco_1036398, partial [Tanacetum coccineum]
MSTPTQCWLWDRMGTPTQCDMLCDTFVVSIMRKVKLGRLASETVGLHAEFPYDSLLLKPLCCDDIHEVTPRVSALAGCDRLVSEPGYKDV